MLPDQDLRETVRTRTFYAVLAAITLGTFTYSTILPHALAHMVNKGMGNAPALSALGTLAAAGVCGKLLFGWMSERFTARRMLISNLVGQAAFTALLGVAAHTGVVAIAAPLYGLFMGGFGALYILVVQESFGMRHYGSVMGTHESRHGGLVRPRSAHRGGFLRCIRRLRRGLSHRLRPVRGRRSLARIRTPSSRGSCHGVAAAFVGRRGTPPRPLRSVPRVA